MAGRVGEGCWPLSGAMESKEGAKVISISEGWQGCGARVRGLAAGSCQPMRI
jgi:hypothetical protein